MKPSAHPIEKEGNQQRADALANKIGTLILRRTKDQVATELPPKTEIPHLIELGTDEKDLYETVRSTMDKHVRQALAIRGQEAQIVFLDALLKLRQICCHQDLIANKESDPASDPASENISQGPKQSAKFDYLKELLETLKQENRKVTVILAVHINVRHHRRTPYRATNQLPQTYRSEQKPAGSG